jgi:hypothetical protein
MKLAAAIANSVGNKAKAISDNDGTVIVQERYAHVGVSWLHVWYSNLSSTQETDIPLPDGLERLKAYGVDPDEKYWTSV